jgi:probable F420-dependent oxidoreductase
VSIADSADADGDGTGRLAFGVNLGRLGTAGPPGEDPAPGPVEVARWAEDAGFEVVTTADHFGGTSPFVMLGAAAVATSRVRLRTYVLDVGFWNPALLARDVATLDVLSGGRVEVGLGAGHMPHEHEAVGVPFPPLVERVAGLERFAAELRRRLDDEAFTPRPVQRPVPLLVGAMSRAGLEVAATVGDTVAIAGGIQLRGAPPGNLTIASAALTDERVALVRDVRAARGLPPARLDALLQEVVLDRTPDEVAAAWEAETAGAIRAADIVDSPFLLAARGAEAAAQELLARRERWGITSWCTHAPSGRALAEVIRAVRGCGA